LKGKNSHAPFGGHVYLTNKNNTRAPRDAAAISRIVNRFQLAGYALDPGVRHPKSWA
jgi:hypothetical protein